MSGKIPIGIDIDGVLLDPDIQWRAFFREQYRLKNCSHRFVFEDENATEWLHWPTACPSCFDYCLRSPDVLLRHAPRSYAQPVLSRHAAAFEFHCISHRSLDNEQFARRLIQDLTFEWLNRHNLRDLFSNIMFVEDKRAYCEENGLLLHLDDSPHVIGDLINSSVTRPVIYSRLYNRTFNDVMSDSGTPPAVAHLPNCKTLEISDWRDFDEMLVKIRVGELQTTSASS